MRNAAWGDDMAGKPTKEEMSRLIKEMSELFEAKDWGSLFARAGAFIKKFPEEAEGYFYRGSAKNKLGRDEEAIKDYDKSIELGPHNANIYYNRGVAKNKLGRHEEAIKDYDKAIELDPHNASTYYKRGNTKVQLEDYDGAIKDYDKAIELDPHNASAYNNRGSAKDKLGRHEEAIKDYDKVIELDPEISAAYNNRGTAKGELGRYEEAIKDYDKAIELNDQEPAYFHNRAMAIGKRAAKESEEKLVNTYEEALKDANDEYQYHLKQFTDPHQIIKFYEDEVNRSSLRTYGTKSFTTKKEDKEKKAQRLEESGNQIKKSAWHLWHGLGHFSHWFGHRVLPNCLEKKASYSNFLLRFFILAIFAFLLMVYMADNLFDFISVLFKFSLSGFTNLKLFKGHITEITFEKVLSLISFQAILSAHFYLYTRRANREFQEERVRLHALMRDRNLLLFWSAQERKNKALFSSKLFDQMTQSSTADLSLRMMNPRQAARFQEARRPLIQGDKLYDKENRDKESQDKRDANLLEKIADLTK